jgi:hypothetical protein
MRIFDGRHGPQINADRIEADVLDEVGAGAAVEERRLRRAETAGDLDGVVAGAAGNR